MFPPALGVCSHTPHLLPARSRLPHKSQFTEVAYLASASRSPRICWSVRASQARDDAQLDPVADRIGPALQPPGQLADLPHGPVSGRRGPGGVELWHNDKIGAPIKRSLIAYDR